MFSRVVGVRRKEMVRGFPDKSISNEFMTLGKLYLLYKLSSSGS